MRKKIYFILKASEQGKLSVYNLMGNAIFTRSVQAGSCHTVSVLPSTIYLVKFNNEVPKVIVR
jgi:hypothetical protein